MKDVKRIEIIIGIPALPVLLEAMREMGLTDYTVYHNLTGSGHRGERLNDEPAGGSGNACVLLALPPESLNSILEHLRPILRTHGGICLVSDAKWLLH